MIRIALITYLTISAALGPAFCCCQIGQIVPGFESTSSCCNSRAVSADHDCHSNKSCIHHDGVADHHSASYRTDDRQQPSEDQRPQSPCKPNCPCGKHDPGMLVSSVGEVSIFGSSVLFGTDWLLGTSSPTTLTDLPGKTANFLDVRPALLSGREILRAYQTMRC